MKLYLFSNKNICGCCGDRFSRILIFSTENYDDDYECEYVGDAAVFDVDDAFVIKYENDNLTKIDKDDCIVSSGTYCYDCDDDRLDAVVVCLEQILDDEDDVADHVCSMIGWNMR